MQEHVFENAGSRSSGGLLTAQAPPLSPPRLPTVRRYDRLKRLLDVVGAVVLLILTAPIMLAVALLVLVTLGRPVMFRHPRPGRDGELFQMVKFRTMRPVDPTRGLVADADRLTRVGQWLRACSLDELPELWNVLRGDMSLIGPRPLLIRYLDRYTPEQARRHEVRPGITGLAQVKGRNSLSWEEKFAYDVEYVDNRSLLLDLKILVATVRVVLSREGVAAPGVATGCEFLGTAAYRSQVGRPANDPGADGIPTLPV
ncbi:sugar transferase [Micromonospora sp. NPDC049891]|uniref:sugar transferase n=1 Tax=Micromonospora sp. NPDC049891 TaxID=3155655 RepID=UPI0033D89CA2